MGEPETMQELESWLYKELEKRPIPPTPEKANKIVEIILSGVRSDQNIPAFLKGYGNPSSNKESRG